MTNFRNSVPADDVSRPIANGLSARQKATHEGCRQRALMPLIGRFGERLRLEQPVQGTARLFSGQGYTINSRQETSWSRMLTLVGCNRSTRRRFILQTKDNPVVMDGEV